MKFLLIIIIFLKLGCFAQNPSCNLLPNGTYLVHFKDSLYKDYQLTITDSLFNQVYKNGDSLKGKAKWLYNCKFRLEFLKYDSVHAPLKIMYDSWGKPCIELQDVHGDTILFRTTHPGNLHITVNDGYFIKQPVLHTGHEKESVNKIDEINQLKSYKIIKIDSIRDVYILSVLRSDTLYKILSYKDPSNICRNIIVNNTYKLNLKSLFVRGFTDSSGRRFDITPDAVQGLTSFEYHGVSVSIDNLPNHKNDLFEATNLKGLCFVKNDK